MIDKFILDLENLLTSNKYEYIDVLPLIDQYFSDLNKEEQLKKRINVQTIIRRLKQDGLVDFKDGYFDITSNLPTRNSFIRSTYNFYKQQQDKELKSLLNSGVNNGQIINVNDNSSLYIKHNKSNNTSSTKYNSIPKTKKSLLEIMSWIVAIIAGIIAIYEFSKK